MKIPDLINQLSFELKPVHKIKFTFIDVFKILLTGLFCLLAAVLSLGLRLDIDDQIVSIKFVFEILLLVFLAVLSTIAAFNLSIPNKNTKNIYKFSLIGLFGFVLFLVYSFLNDSEPFAYYGHSFACAYEILLISVIPSSLLFYFIRKAAVLKRDLVGALVLLSGTAFGLLGVQLTCVDGSLLHILIWHILPAVVILSLSLIISKKILIKI